MLATFLLGSAVLWTFLLVGKAKDDGALVSSWFDMFERCRASVETHEPLFMFNLLPNPALVDPLKNIDARHIKMWSPLVGGGRFAVLEREDVAASGVFRSCEVVLSDWHRPLSRLDIERLTYTFMEERSVLLAKGSHEARDPVPLTRLTSAGFRTSWPNPMGCPVVTAMFAQPELGDFRVISGEQETACSGGPSFMKPST
jgi:hypothetical protein